MGYQNGVKVYRGKLYIIGKWNIIEFWLEKGKILLQIFLVNGFFNYIEV